MELDDDPQTAPPVPSDELGGDDAGVPEVAWGFSTLTASGCPLEISFNTTAPCVRYTAEVAGAEHDHADRMALALGLTAELSGGQRFPPELVDELVRLQHCGTLHWGAWIGGRHDGRRSRFKVYAEVPRDMPSRDLAARWFPGIDRVGYRHPRLEGVGRGSTATKPGRPGCVRAPRRGGRTGFLQRVRQSHLAQPAAPTTTRVHVGCFGVEHYSCHRSGWRSCFGQHDYQGRYMMKSTKAVTVAAISAALLSSPWGIAPVQADDLSGDVIGCPADVPCINELYQEGSTLHIGWDGHEHFDHYNLRWSRPGRDETQYETAGGSHGSFSINNINAGMVYTVKVQGCDTNFFGESTCSGWGDGQFKAKANLPYGPDTCKQGYVWREARPSDHVCVSPAVRSQTAQENQLAASRRSPNGGAYGPDTCNQGYVWREAFVNDHVCVVPQSRSAAKADNAVAASRRVVG